MIRQQTYASRNKHFEKENENPTKSVELHPRDNNGNHKLADEIRLLRFIAPTQLQKQRA